MLTRSVITVSIMLVRLQQPDAAHRSGSRQAKLLLRRHDLHGMRVHDERFLDGGVVLGHLQ